MTVYDTILKRRTIRKFKQHPIPKTLLEKMINVARLAPSGANLQPLEYILVTENHLLDAVFSTTRWAAYLAPEGTPKPDERPVAFIIVLINRKIRPSGGQHDAGASIMSMILTALEENVASCWIASIEKEKLRTILNIPEHLEIDSILASGYPDEESVPVDLQDSIKYWKNEQGVLHVPKRSIEDISHWNGYQPMTCSNNS